MNSIPNALPSELLANSFDSVIIGAGISGLAAAADFYAKNVSFVMLEARNRIGGRIWSDRTLGAPCDLGASWIHQSGPTNPITIEAIRLKIGRSKTDEESSDRWLNDGLKIDMKRFHEFSDSQKNFLDKVEKSRDQLDKDISVADVMKIVDKKFFEDPENNFHFAWDLESEYGAPLEDVSAWNYDADMSLPGNKQAEEIFPTGYDSLTNGISEPFRDKILLNKVVVEINWTDDKQIIVTCEDGTFYSAKSLVITVPLGVLKSDSLKFVPEIPKKHRAAIEKLGMGVALNKIFLKFENDFWSEFSKETFFSCASGGAPETRGKFCQFLNGKKMFGANILLGFAFGTYSKLMESKTDEEIKNDAMLTLKKIFPNAQEPLKFIISRWNSDPFSKGSYSFQAVGSSPEDYRYLQVPIGERIFLAGEHTHQEYRATVHGAYISGKRAADHVLYFLWENSLL